jgi:sugar phosphate permease
MTVRHRVLVFLSLLSVITNRDRVCLSVAEPRMQQALSLSPEQWGWLTGAFTLAYALFEMPSGSLGDSCWQPSLAGVGRRLATRRELLRENFRVPTGRYPALRRCHA